jgi:organic hydroperoxide reductase OsmC/OhrA
VNAGLASLLPFHPSMQPFPHHYRVQSSAAPQGTVLIESDTLPALQTATPPEFGGPSGWWSPETLLVAAVVDCYALTFKGLARAAGLPWLTLTVDGVGTLERPERVTRFTRIDLAASLVLPADDREQEARRLLVRAEETCLITRSLSAAVHLDIAVACQPAEVAATA